MKRVHLVGRKNHGKTELMLELLRELSSRRLRVGSFKHSGHEHVLDTPGKDSFRHREAGASPSAIVTPSSIGLFLPLPPGISPYDLLAPFYEHCDVILVEGHASLPGPKIEVWRAEVGTPPLANEFGGIEAVVTDDIVDVPCPVWPRHDLPVLGTALLELLSSDELA